MTSILKVSTLKDPTNSNTALQIDTSGRVTMPNTVEIDLWRLTAAFSTNGVAPTGWERSDNATSAYAGTGMTESSGVFTFPSTGLWKVTFVALMQNDTSETSAGILGRVSTDSGSSYTIIVSAYESQPSNANLFWQTLVNVTNASTFRFSLLTSGFNTNTRVAGSSDRDNTSIMFERITDAQ